jgi:hypothetical protein
MANPFDIRGLSRLYSMREKKHRSNKSGRRLSLLPELERDAVRFKDFFCCPVAEVGSPFVCGSRVPEQSAMPYSSSSGNRLLAMPVKSQNSTFETP